MYDTLTPSAWTQWRSGGRHAGCRRLQSDCRGLERVTSTHHTHAASRPLPSALPRPNAAHPPRHQSADAPPPGSPATSEHTQHEWAAGGCEDPTHRKFYNETDVIKSMPEKRIVLTIDPNELKEGVCKIYPSKDERFAVCLEDEKIKIFPIEE
uniref:Uncharacterized protein n=1 Tax=Candidatus Methanogaster sp. ANME-2c ERB4 TaxID=2759911 RepID=A0A7G9YEI6_9EURY|nr:hypothetical protein NIBJONLA_00037 [Methanosarcinales archaeon ANME-2c ERB4]